VDNPYFWWIGFNLLIIVLLALDLGVFHRHAHEISLKEAIYWSIIWIIVALAFNALLYFRWPLWPAQETEYTPHKASLAFLTAYLIERALSMDNIFVFLVIFNYFQVPAKFQHRVLFWGIFGALVMRAFFLWAGFQVIDMFHWTIYVLGAFLIYTGIKLLFTKDKKIEPEKNPVIKLARRMLPVTHSYESGKFLTRENGVRVATPLLLVLLFVESTDLIFAVDSIPAVLGVSKDLFIVYSSNVFAILGLRALYFALAGCMQIFRYLPYGLSAVLVFIGAKMLFEPIYEIPMGLSLGVVAALLTISVAASLLAKPEPQQESPPPVS